MVVLVVVPRERERERDTERETRRDRERGERADRQSERAYIYVCVHVRTYYNMIHKYISGQWLHDSLAGRHPLPVKPNHSLASLPGAP